MITLTTVVWGVTLESDTSVLSISSDEVNGTIRESTWDVNTGRESAPRITQMNMGLFFELIGKWPVAFSPTSDFVVFASDPTTLRNWNLTGKAEVADIGQTQQGERELSGITAVVGAVALSPGMQWMAAGSHSDIQLWNLNSGEQSLILTGYKGEVRLLEFAQDGQTLISSAGDGRIDVWEISSRSKIFGLRGKYAFGSRTRVGVADTAGNIRMIDLPGRGESHFSIGPLLEVSRIGINDDATLIATGSQLFSNVQVFRSSGGSPIQNVHTSFNYNSELRFSPDNKYLAWGTNGSTDAEIVVLNIETGKTTHLCCHGRWASTLAFSNDGKQLFSGGSDHQIRMWDLARVWSGDVHETSILKGHTGERPRHC